jgi:hypothetical protein
MSTGLPNVLAHQGAPGAFGPWPVSLVTGATPPGVTIEDALGRAVAIDAFDRLKVGTPYTLADIVNKYEIDTRTWSTAVVGAATIAHAPANSAVRLTVTGANGDSATLRTNEYFRYQGGKALNVKHTCIHADVGKTNQTRRWGYYDANDGIFFELSGTALRLVRRTSTSGAPVDNVVAQSAWSYDHFDGTGPSGITLNITKGNIYEIDLQWLSVGEVYIYINGKLAHVFSNSNALTAPYMRTAVLPVSAEVVNTAASTGSSFDFICATVEVSGGTVPPEESFGTYNAADIVVGATERPILSIQNKLTYNSIVNRAVVLPSLLTVWTETVRAQVRLVFNPALTGSAFSSVTTRSTVEFDVAATAFTGGETIIPSLVPVAVPLIIPIEHLFRHDARKMRLSAAGTVPDILSVLAVNLGPNPGNTNMRAAITWREVR